MGVSRRRLDGAAHRDQRRRGVSAGGSTCRGSTTILRRLPRPARPARAETHKPAALPSRPPPNQDPPSSISTPAGEAIVGCRTCLAHRQPPPNSRSKSTTGAACSCCGPRVFFGLVAAGEAGAAHPQGAVPPLDNPGGGLAQFQSQRLRRPSRRDPLRQAGARSTDRRCADRSCTRLSGSARSRPRSTVIAGWRTGRASCGKRRDGGVAALSSLDATLERGARTLAGWSTRTRSASRGDRRSCSRAIWWRRWWRRRRCQLPAMMATQVRGGGGRSRRGGKGLAVSMRPLHWLLRRLLPELGWRMPELVEAGIELVAERVPPTEPDAQRLVLRLRRAGAVASASSRRRRRLSQPRRPRRVKGWRSVIVCSSAAICRRPRRSTVACCQWRRPRVTRRSSRRGCSACSWRETAACARPSGSSRSWPSIRAIV